MAKRLTQRDIARIAGVSQATVSLVLNSAPASVARIPDETRKRVHEAIAQTGYVADPVARSLVNAKNQILGVFTYEPAFPSAQVDFFTPFLFGIEEAAQDCGYDLLLLTGRNEQSSGKKRLFEQGRRLRLADGCLILGAEMDRDELAQLLASEYPFVAIGRRDDAGGPVPYVGADYVTATRKLVEEAMRQGHRRMAYIGPTDKSESRADRWKGFSGAVAKGGEIACQIPDIGMDPEELADRVLASGATVAFFVELADAIPFRRTLLARGHSVPGDMSVIVLGRHIRPEATGTRFTTYVVPREEMGRRATALLVAMLSGRAADQQVLLDCDIVPGETLGPIKEKP